MSEWQPIETLPKDGTRVLLFGECPNAFDRPPEWVVGVRAEAADRADYYAIEIRPTCWMPLPDPPMEDGHE